jgi:hypothetical protein
MQKNEVGPLHHVQKLTQKGQDLSIGAFRRKHRYKSSWIWIRQQFLRYNTKKTKKQDKIIDNLDFVKIKKLQRTISRQ